MNTKIRVIIIAVVVIVTLSGLIKACATKSDYVANNTIPPEPVVNQVDDDNTDVLLGLAAGVVAGSLINSTTSNNTQSKPKSTTSKSYTPTVSNNKQSKPKSAISKLYTSKNKTKTRVNKQVKSKSVSLKKKTSRKK